MEKSVALCVIIAMFASRLCFTHGKECKDTGHTGLCLNMKRFGYCASAQDMCSKTCGFCSETTKTQPAMPGSPAYKSNEFLSINLTASLTSNTYGDEPEIYVPSDDIDNDIWHDFDIDFWNKRKRSLDAEFAEQVELDEILIDDEWKA